MDSSADPDNHGLIRSDFPGGWEGDVVNAFTGEGLNRDQLHTQALVRKLLRWRKDAGVIHGGNLMHFSPQDSVYVYFRYDNHDCVMIVINYSELDQDLDLSRFHERLNGYRSARDIISGNKYELKGILSAPAREPLVLELE